MIFLEQIMAITSRVIRNRWREMMKRIVACRSQAIADVRSQDAASRYPLVPSRRNVEKWRCRASIIKLHLQSTLHYNTTACASRLQVGIPVQISRGRVTNDWRRRRHRKKNYFAAPAKGPEMCVPLGPGQSLMISLLFAHQFKPRHPLCTPRHRR